MKKLKGLFHSLSHPTNIRSWLLLQIVVSGFSSIIAIAIDSLLIVPLMDVEDGGIGDILSSCITITIIYTLTSLYTYRKLFFNFFKRDTSDKVKHETEDSKK